jgi:unsaturated rhamnogalacturonyl hydrolase
VTQTRTVVFVPLALLAFAAAPASAGAAEPAPPPPTAATPPPVAVKVQNPLPAARTAETVALTLAALRKHSPGLEAPKLVVVDAKKQSVLSQLVDSDGDDAPDEIVFQTDLGPKESKSFTVEAGARPTSKADDFKVYGRFVRERHDDFAWENDRVAHRMYGPDLEIWKKEPLTSSGIDVWVKRAKRLVVNEWYMTDDYHRDNGDGADFYSVSKSRGCGGVAIFSGEKPAVSRNFATSRVLTNGPIRLIFELGYAPFDAGAGVKVSETKRISLDAGHNFNRITSTFKTEGGGPAKLDVGVGVGKHPNTDLKTDKQWIRTWEKVKDDDSSLGCAIVLATISGTPGVLRSTDLDTFLVSKVAPGAPFVYYMGSEWSKRPGGATDAAAWTKEVQEQARDNAAPVKVTLSAAKK